MLQGGGGRERNWSRAVRELNRLIGAGRVSQSQAKTKKPKSKNTKKNTSAKPKKQPNGKQTENSKNKQQNKKNKKNYNNNTRRSQVKGERERTQWEEGTEKG